MDFNSIAGLLGGLGLFLFGMKFMGEGLELLAGDRMKNLFEKIAGNKYKGAGVGFLVTVLAQSSSATTVMVVGFVNAGLMTLSQATGIIMGANIGTTTTSILISFKWIESFAPIALFIGVAMMMFCKNKKINNAGFIVLGFGAIFVGMNGMSESMAGLREVDAFVGLMSKFSDNPLLAILSGALVTAIIQSSAASIGMLQSFAVSGVISLKGAAYVLFGQNIGTCITALLASVGTSKTAKKTTLVHFMFNVIGTIVFSLINAFTPLASWIEMAVPDPKFQIAVMHVVFNVVTTVMLLPMSDVLVNIANKLIPEGEDAKTLEPMRLKYLDELILKNPPIAVAQVLKEVNRMAVITHRNLESSMHYLSKPHDDNAQVYRNKVLAQEKVVNYLNHNITKYMIKIDSIDISEDDSQMIGSLFHVINDLERISDHCENIIEFEDELLKDKLEFSEAAFEEIKELYDKSMTVFECALSFFSENVNCDEMMRTMLDAENEVDRFTEELKWRHVRRLNDGICRPEVGMVFLELISNFERIADHSTNIAYSIASGKRLPVEGK